MANARVDIRVKMIIPKVQFKDIFVKDSLYKKIDNTTRYDLINKFKGTTEGWETNVDFGSHILESNTRIGIQVFPSKSNIYNMVTLGSPSHYIPKKPGFIRYQRGYVSATLPGSLRSIGKRRFGDFTTSKQVLHPGFTARQFDYYIAKEYTPTFYKDMQEAIDEAASEFNKS